MLDVRPFLLIPYKHGGRDYDGADCGGFILIFYRDILKVNIPDINEPYDVNWSCQGKDHFVENYHKLFERIESPERYDIVMFHNRQGVVNHGGIVLGYGKFIHCCRDGVLIDNYKSANWQKRLDGFYRFKEKQ